MQLFDAQRRADAIMAQAGLTKNGSAAYDPHIHDERVYRRVLMWGSIGLGDSYMDGWWDAERLDLFFERILRVDAEYRTGRTMNAFMGARERLFNVQSIRRALQVAEHHYDLGNDLYRAFLGESMAYSAAYYRAGADSLTDAQGAKFERICTALSLTPGMRILEIGSGWGTFAAYAAKKYGVEVVGVTVSKEQLSYAEDVCKGLPVSFYFGDYRTLPSSYHGAFDRVVSIEMIEAVGVRHLGTYMNVARTLLKNEGLFLIQAITGSGIPDSWISTRIFPNGVLPTMTQIVSAARRHFHVESVENFSADYDRTLMAWDDAFRAAWPTIRTWKDEKGNVRYDERFFRMWHYYLTVCAALFRLNKIQVSHILLTTKGVTVWQ